METEQIKHIILSAFLIIVIAIASIMISRVFETSKGEDSVLLWINTIITFACIATFLSKLEHGKF